MQTDEAPLTPSAGAQRPADEPPRFTRSRPLRPTVDELSEWSFPASDPPPSWTWDPPTQDR